MEHDLDKAIPVLPRDKREAFAGGFSVATDAMANELTMTANLGAASPLHIF
jgi:hypothetical protein